jgi:UDP-N-acetylmuramate--alanine ligase
MKQKIHFIGVKGVGMAPLAIIAKEAGFDVSGCDVADEFITDSLLRKAGVTILEGFSKDHLNGIDTVIATGAHGGSRNPEVIEAKNLSLPIFSQGEALSKFQSGEFFNKHNFAISVAGSHGKTTTTAMIATILKSAKQDPSFSIGTGYVPFLESNGHYGQGKYFVAEADEYVVDAEADHTPKFMLLNPDLILITNIDYDHPDIYKSFVDIEKAFLDFSNKLSPDKTLVINGDGQKNQDFIKKFEGQKITYGISPTNQVIIAKITNSAEKTFFRLSRDGQDLGEFVLNIFGEQNVVNAAGSIAACMELGISISEIKEGIAKFRGTKRRSEFIGETKDGALVYDDYGHHPEEIKETLKAFRKRFPKDKIICVFQPHMYSRTKTLLADFINSFDAADEVIITEIFPSFRETPDPNFSAKKIEEGINLKNRKAIFLSKLSDVVKYFEENLPKNNTVVITMGAGDIYKVSESLKIK